MIILDTNVLSALMGRVPDKAVIEWLDRQPRSSVWTTAVTVLEVEFGLQILASGRRKDSLLQAFRDVMADRISGRIAPFDAAAARRAAELMSDHRKRGRPIELRDTMIGGIVLACHATLATRNTSHFEDLTVPVVDPWLR